MLEAVTAFFVATAGGALLVLWLLDLLRAADRPTTGPSRWSVAPTELPTSYATLLLASLAALFLELTLIRWISSEIPIFAYFKNILLIACYLGFGLGALTCRRRIFPALALAPLLYLAALIHAPWDSLHEILNYLPDYFGAFSEVQTWGVPYLPTGMSGVIRLVAAMALVAPLLALVAIALMPFGQLIGSQLEAARNGIGAYTVNIIGSLLGIAVFTTASFFEAPPLLWMAIFAVFSLTLVWPARALRWISAAGLAGCLALLAINTEPDAKTYWSPYQKLTLREVKRGNVVLWYRLETNGAAFQEIIPQAPEFLRRYPILTTEKSLELLSYELPYRFQPHPKSVLVLGSGMGNDVAAALLHGASRVVAVEIDPRILRLGRERHPDQPYGSPRVTVLNDDARAFLQRNRERFDLIVFGLLDSHTTVSHFTNVRLDNYVYTIEALTAARRALTDDGVFTVKFWVAAPWIGGRLDRLLTTVFGDHPLPLAWRPGSSLGGQLFVGGARASILRAVATDPWLAAFVQRHLQPVTQSAPTTSDDWPFFYQRFRGLPLPILLLALLSAGLLWGGLRRLGIRHLAPGTAMPPLGWSLFFLGAGFLLVEVQAVSRAALLFGTTWLVNTVVIAGLLFFILAANAVAAAAKPTSPLLGYCGLALSLVLSWAIPTSSLYVPSFWLRVALAVLVLCLPVFFAGLVFIHTFGRSAFSGAALGANLLGALTGGLLESLSLWLGMRALILIALTLYGAAALSYLRGTRRAYALATALQPAANLTLDPP